MGFEVEAMYCIFKMAPHYLLDTRTIYQRVRDWVCSLFRSKQKANEVEVTRFLSSFERENRLRLSNSRPTVPIRGLREETGKTYRKTRVCLVILT